MGKLTHYLADAFTYPHNENYPDSLMEHRRYEDTLREYLSSYLNVWGLCPAHPADEDVIDCLKDLHRQYMEAAADMRRDVRYIIQATSLLMEGVAPQPVLA